MRHPLKILLAGRPNLAFSELEALLSNQRQFLVTARAIGNGEDKSISELESAFNAVVLVLDKDWRGMLSACFPKETPSGKPLLVVGPPGDTELLRMAMRLGGRDFFTLPPTGDELIPALDRLATEEHDRHGGLSARVTTFMNGKGGSGASICAANYAHILAERRDRRVVLLDFEMQFGSLCTYFNLQSRSGLVRALEMVDSLDESALQGYTQKHPSGLYLLSAAAEGLVLPDDIHEERVAKLFGVLDEAFEDLVIDLPRRIDQASAAVLDRSDRVMLVVQQTVAHLQEIKRLVGVLDGVLGITPDRLLVIVNRYQKRGELTLKDFSGALPGVRVEGLPNDYANVSQSINLGIPLLQHAPRSPFCKSLLALEESFAQVDKPGSTPPRRGPLAWLPRAH